MEPERGAAPPLVFVLDQNFPRQSSEIPWPQPLVLERLPVAHPDLVASVDDWEIILELQHRGAAGFVTNDAQILNSPRELVALSRTTLTLVVTEGTGHDPLVANGLLQVHLGEIAADGNTRPTIYRLRKTGKSVDSPARRLNTLAANRNRSPAELHRDELAAIRQAVAHSRPHLAYLAKERLGKGSK